MKIHLSKSNIEHSEPEFSLSHFLSLSLSLFDYLYLRERERERKVITCSTLVINHTSNVCLLLLRRRRLFFSKSQQLNSVSTHQMTAKQTAC